MPEARFACAGQLVAANIGDHRPLLALHRLRKVAAAARSSGRRPASFGRNLRKCRRRTSELVVHPANLNFLSDFKAFAGSW
jgi:hypothetical protein